VQSDNYNNGMDAYIKFASLPCNRKCPCRIWPQCDKYRDFTRKQERLSKKEYDFHEWFDNSFKIDYGMHGLYMG